MTDILFSEVGHRDGSQNAKANMPTKANRFGSIIWVGIDKRKQGWHDKLVGTVVFGNTQ